MARDPINLAKVMRVLEAVFPNAAVLGPYPNVRESGVRAYLVLEV